MTKMNRVVETEPTHGAAGMNPQKWARTWNLMRADGNMARDVLNGAKQSTLELEYDAATGRFTPVGRVPPAFAGVPLELKGSKAPLLETVGIDPLPRYSDEHETHYE